jgi:hypothetical protein
MIALNKLDPAVAQQFRAITDMREQEQKAIKASSEDTVDFYLKNYQFVQIVRCLRCGSDLCLWYLDPGKVRQNMAQLHHMGLTRVQLSDNLRSTRMRHDGLMGYKCICGNNSLLADIEKNIVPQAKGVIPSDELHTGALVRKKMLATNFTPKTEIIDNKEIIDGFEHTILKGGVGL